MDKKMDCIKKHKKAKREKDLKKTDEVIVINDDDIHDTKPVHKKKKKSERTVKLDSLSKNRESLVITQKVELKRKKIQCVINLTNVNEHEHRKKRKHSSCKRSKKLRLPRQTTDRIVPQCLRRQCSLAILAKCCEARKVEQKKADSIGYLSPVSSIVLEDSCPSTISYENISSGNLSDISEEGTDELNTLIMRTKERERKFGKENYESLYTGTPHTEVRERALTEETEESLHSVPTLILEPLSDNLYSPTHPTVSPERSTIYSSPTTPSKLVIDEDRLYTPTKNTTNISKDPCLGDLTVPIDAKEFHPIETLESNNNFSEQTASIKVKNEVHSPLLSFENLFGSDKFPMNNNRYFAEYSQYEPYSSSQTTIKTEKELTQSWNYISPEPKSMTKGIKRRWMEDTQNCLLNYKCQRSESEPKSECISSNFQSEVSTNNNNLQFPYIKIENSDDDFYKQNIGYNHGISDLSSDLDYKTAIKPEPQN